MDPTNFRNDFSAMKQESAVMAEPDDADNIDDDDDDEYLLQELFKRKSAAKMISSSVRNLNSALDDMAASPDDNQMRSGWRPSMRKQVSERLGGASRQRESDVSRLSTISDMSDYDGRPSLGISDLQGLLLEAEGFYSSMHEDDKEKDKDESEIKEDEEGEKRSDTTLESSPQRVQSADDDSLYELEVPKKTSNGEEKLPVLPSSSEDDFDSAFKELRASQNALSKFIQESDGKLTGEDEEVVAGNEQRRSELKRTNSNRISLDSLSNHSDAAADDDDDNNNKDGPPTITPTPTSGERLEGGKQTWDELDLGGSQKEEKEVEQKKPPRTAASSSRRSSWSNWWGSFVEILVSAAMGSLHAKRKSKKAMLLLQLQELDPNLADELLAEQESQAFLVKKRQGDIKRERLSKSSARLSLVPAGGTKTQEEQIAKLLGLDKTTAQELLKRCLARFLFGSKTRRNNKRSKVITLEEERMIREEFLKTKIIDIGFDERAIQRSREQQEAFVNRAETRKDSRRSLLGRMFSSSRW